MGILKNIEIPYNPKLVTATFYTSSLVFLIQVKFQDMLSLKVCTHTLLVKSVIDLSTRMCSKNYCACEVITMLTCEIRQL